MTKSAKPQRFSSARKFLQEYRRSKLGIVGIVIILFFVILAGLAPVISTHNPIKDQNLASPLSIPIWARAFPQYANYPVNYQFLSGAGLSNQSDLAHWQILSRPSTNDPAKGYVSYNATSRGLILNFYPGNTSSNSILSQFNQQSNPSLVLNQTFAYPWRYPCGFLTSFSLTPLSQNLSTNQLSVDVYMKSVSGRTFHVLGPSVYTDPGDTVLYFQNFKANTPYHFVTNPTNPYVSLIATGSTAVVNLGPCGLTQGIFSHEGNVTVTIVVTSKVATKVLISNPQISVEGSAYGLLGTDNLGRDVWSQFVYGAQVSLVVGLLAALIAVIIGTGVGLLAGFAGGFVDEVLMRFNDFLLVLPGLPLILVILEILSISGAGKAVNTELLILVIISLLGWNGIARIIRSQVLSVKQRQFVEAARALGAKDRHIIWKHVLPNVMGLVYANIALSVPGFILLEAALTFLGFGDPSTISWGTMLSNAQIAFTSALHDFVWWWFFPPGIAIAVISMAFIFVGFSLDAILNPKLRRR